MSTDKRKILITLFLRENCQVSIKVLKLISNCEKVAGLIQLKIIDLDIQENAPGIYISPTIVIDAEIFAVGAINQYKFVEKVLSLSS